MVTNKTQNGSRQVIIVLLAAWIARYVFAWFMPPEVRSVDILSWENVAGLLATGANPYKDSAQLNWPPLWMQLIYLMSKVSTALDVPFILVLRIFLTAVDSLVIVALFRLIRLLDPKANAFIPVLLGIAINPTVILLTCQHGNFDVIIALCAVLFVIFLIQHYRTQNEMDWLIACLFLGLGILAKTVPLVLCPMLAGGWKRAGWRTRVLGAVILFGPVALGMSVIYVLAPQDVAAKVIAYRSASDYFGISGLLHLAGLENLLDLSKLLFYLLLAGAGIGVASAFWRLERPPPRQIVLCAAMLLVAIPGIGPGYSPQYLYWSLPLLIAVAPAGKTGLQWAVWAFCIVAAATCLVEYAIFPSQGAYLLNIMKDAHSPALRPLALHLGWWISPPGQAVIRLPLFIAFLALLIIGIRLLVRNFRAEARAPIAGQPAA